MCAFLFRLRLLGTYGLRCKKEVWRTQLTLSKLRKAARVLLTLPANDERRQFEGKRRPPPLAILKLIITSSLTGEALIRRMVKLGLLKDSERKLDYVLGLTIAQFLERRLQTLVVKRKLATSVHHARVLIRQKHIAVGKQMVNIPSFMVRVSSEQHIQNSAKSVFKTGKLGRTKRRKQAGGAKDDD